MQERVVRLSVGTVAETILTSQLVCTWKSGCKLRNVRGLYTTIRREHAHFDAVQKSYIVQEETDVVLREVVKGLDNVCILCIEVQVCRIGVLFTVLV